MLIAVIVDFVPLCGSGHRQQNRYFAVYQADNVICIVAREIIHRIFFIHIGRPTGRDGARSPSRPRITHAPDADLCGIGKRTDDMNQSVLLDKQILLNGKIGIKFTATLRIVVVVDLRIA